MSGFLVVFYDLYDFFFMIRKVINNPRFQSILSHKIFDTLIIYMYIYRFFMLRAVVILNPEIILLKFRRTNFMSDVFCKKRSYNNFLLISVTKL